MEPQSSWNNVQKTIASGLKGNQDNWPKQVYDALINRDFVYTEITHSGITENVVKLAIKQAIDDYQSRRQMITLTTFIYNALTVASFLKA